MNVKEIESAIEGILFASGDPVSVERICHTLDIDRGTVDAVAKELGDFYRFERRGIRLLKLDGAYQLCSAPEYAAYVRKAFETRKPPRLSPPALEALAIVAYFQPVTRAYIEQVRGVDSAYTVGVLLERGLIEECGRLDAPGRPMQFRTTRVFLRTFGLTALEELPPLPGGVDEEQLRIGGSEEGGE